MKEAELRKYARLMHELGLTGLEIDEVRGTVRMECNPGEQPVGRKSVSVPVESGPAPAVSGDLRVTSPIVGIFYAAPMENAEPYVRVGDHVKKGDVLFIVEAMKLMNEIVADSDGVITEICVENGQLVDYGCLLFKMEVQS